MEDIITIGSAATYAEAYADGDVDGTQEGHDVEHQGAEVEEDVEADEKTLEAPEEQAAKGKKKRKAGEGGLNRVKCTAKEDECLVEERKMVSLDPITNVKQNNDTYWRMV